MGRKILDLAIALATPTCARSLAQHNSFITDPTCHWVGTRNAQRAAPGSCRYTEPGTPNENRTEISRIEPHRFLYLIRSNPYFLIRFYRFRFRISDVLYFKCKSRKRFRHFSTVFYFSIFNLKYSELKIQFKPNLANCTGHTAQLQAAHHAVVFFLLVASYHLL